MFSTLIFSLILIKTYQTCQSMCSSFVTGTQAIIVNKILWRNVYVDYYFPYSCYTQEYFELSLSVNSIDYNNNAPDKVKYQFYCNQTNSVGMSIYYGVGDVSNMQQGYDSWSLINSIQLSYLSFKKGYGIQKINIPFSSLQYLEIISQLKYYSSLSDTQLLQNKTNDADYIVSVNFPHIYMTWSANSQISQTWFKVDKQLRLLLRINDQSEIKNITMTVIIFQKSKIQNYFSSINYLFDLKVQSDEITSSKLYYSKAKPDASNAFVFTGFNGGEIGKSFLFGIDYDQSNFQTITNNFMNYSKVNKDTYVYGKGTQSYKFIYFRFYTYKPKCPSWMNMFDSTNQKCCSSCPSNTIINGTECQSCNITSYYNQSQSTCLDCSELTLYCARCNSTHCFQCIGSIYSQSSNGQCILCSNNELYDQNIGQCVLCSTIYYDCFTCNQYACTSCKATDRFYLYNYYCLECQSNQVFIYDDGTCFICGIIFDQCIKCENDKCTKCHPYYYLQSESSICIKCNSSIPFCQLCSSSSVCDQCQQGKFFVLNKCINKDLLTFTFQVIKENEQQKIYYCILNFNGSVLIVKQYYNIILYINEMQMNILEQNVQFNDDNNTITIKIQYTRQVAIKIFKIKFINTSSEILLLQKTQDQLTIQNTNQTNEIEKTIEISEIQRLLINGISIITSGISQNSGSIMASLSLTSFASYFINVLWSIQMTSFYTFLKISKPTMLELFLNATIAIQEVNLLPFSFPDIFENDQTIISNELYDKYEIDLYYIRANYETFIQLLIFTFLHFLLFFIFRSIKSQNFIINLLKKMTVQRIYMNISMNLCEILMSITFSSAATLSSLEFSSAKLIINYSIALFGLFVCVSFLVLNTYFLYYYRDVDQFDNEQCYMGINQEKNGSQIQLFFYLLPQLLTPILIPLTHPVFALVVITIVQIINLRRMFLNPIMKMRLAVRLRFIHGITYISINILFFILFIVETGFPSIQTNTFKILGYIIICLFLLTCIAQLIETIAQVVIDIHHLIKKLRLKTRIKQLPHQIQQKPRIPHKSKRKIQRKIKLQNKSISQNKQFNPKNLTFLSSQNTYRFNPIFKHRNSKTVKIQHNVSYNHNYISGSLYEKSQSKNIKQSLKTKLKSLKINKSL